VSCWAAAITVSPNGVRVLTMARHTFDRVVHLTGREEATGTVRIDVAP
jgi:hypothetical protein